MSAKHPVIAVTGSSGSGTSTVKTAFDHIFLRQRIQAMSVEGDSFHRYDRTEMAALIERARTQGNYFSHYSLEANLLEDLERLFHGYGETGKGVLRQYIHDEDEAFKYGQAVGTFTPWQEAGESTDLLLYEGLHGGVVTDKFDLAHHVDLLIGIAPIVNLEWIQKIHRDISLRGYSEEHVTSTILHRMHAYVDVIAPQFALTDINFQRVPVVDTSNPFIARDIPTADESLVVIHISDAKKFDIDFPYLLAMLHDSFMSRRNTIVIPGGKMGLAIELIVNPIIERIMGEREKHF